MSYQVKLAIFEGPFDLLFHLIEKEEIDIYDIPIAKLTQGYLEYLESLDELDIERASEFLVMAAILIEIKAKLLLPSPPLPETDEIQEDPREELVNRLLIYRKFRELAGVLKKMEDEEGQIYTRVSVDRPKPQGILCLKGVSLEGLMDIFQGLLQAAEEEEEIQKIQREKVTIRERVEVILLALERTPTVDFKDFIPEDASKTMVVVTFIALLELVKVGYVGVSQEAPFQKILVSKRTKEDQDLGDRHVSAG